MCFIETDEYYFIYSIIIYYSNKKIKLHNTHYLDFQLRMRPRKPETMRIFVFFFITFVLVWKWIP